MCILCVREARQADVSIWLFCVSFSAVFSLFLTISVLPDKSQTCSVRKQVARGRDMILTPLLRDVRTAVSVSCEWGTGKTFPLAFYFKAVLLNPVSEGGWPLSITCTSVCEKQNK